MDRESRNGASTSRVVKKKKEWSPMFPVPSYLVENYGVLPSKVTFRTDEFEKKWKLKIEKFKDQYFFTDGWEEFEKDVDLKSRELIMYRSASSSKRKGKKKEKRRKVIGNAHGTMNPSLNKAESSGVEKNSGFNMELKKYHQYRVDIPKIFSESTGMIEGDQIKVRNSEGKEWPVHVRNRNNVFSLGGGWFDFLKGNNIVVGTTLSFLSSSTDTIDVQIIKEGTNKEALFEHMRCRGLERGHAI